MDRPYIICHMVTSLDGKVAGDFLGKDAYSGLIEDYYRIHREYGADGFLCGSSLSAERSKKTKRRRPLANLPKTIT